MNVTFTGTKKIGNLLTKKSRKVDKKCQPILCLGRELIKLHPEIL